jgi:aminoglycoside 6'-N-acetyltransferase I
MSAVITNCRPDQIDAWFDLRCALWPDENHETMRADCAPMLTDPDKAVFVAMDGAALTGFAEVALRHDYVPGCETSPVAFLEGIYVAPAQRRKGIARALIGAAEAWGRAKGCSEFASDILLENTLSHRMHTALGFEETERVIYFRKKIENAVRR